MLAFVYVNVFELLEEESCAFAVCSVWFSCGCQREAVGLSYKGTRKTQCGLSTSDGLDNVFLSFFYLAHLYISQWQADKQKPSLITCHHHMAFVVSLFSAFLSFYAVVDCLDNLNTGLSAGLIVKQERLWTLTACICELNSAGHGISLYHATLKMQSFY